MKFGQRPCTIVHGLWPNFGATLKICKKSNFDWNQLNLSKQHKYNVHVLGYSPGVTSSAYILMTFLDSATSNIYTVQINIVQVISLTVVWGDSFELGRLVLLLRISKGQSRN